MNHLSQTISFSQSGIGMACIAIILTPLLGFLINGLFNKKLSTSLVGIIACAAIIIPFLLSCYLFTAIPEEGITVHLFDWINVGNLHLDMSFLVDHLSLVMLLVITGVGSLIHIYSVGYMHHDEDYPRYMSYLNLFVFFMLLLVLGSNYVVMFAGWEGVGLCSYFLIGFWFKNNEYNNAAKKAFVMNRIGDLGFLLGLFLLFQKFGSLSYHEIFGAAPTILNGDATVTAICFLLFVGAMGKSAQIPLYTWLPDAMAGPTPVSALIHAATMVTAGIYMIVRSNILFQLAPSASEFIAIIGTLTALFAATIGLKQTDIKKVLAYSTVSQLGYMFAALGVGAYDSGMFHVVTHAFFKALLFLCAGSVIHAMSGAQDIRSMGGLKKYLPITHLTFLIGVLAISGVPGFAGFFSKDEILSKVYASGHFVLFILLAITSVLTAVYMFRLYWLTFHGNFRGSHDQQHHLHESPTSMTFPLMVLAVLSIVGGYMGMPEWLSEHHLFSSFLHPVTGSAPHIHASHTFEMVVLAVSIIALVLIAYTTYTQYVTKHVVPEDDNQLKGVPKLLTHKYYIDELYENAITKPLNSISAFMYNFVEKYIIDGAVNGTGWLTTNSGVLLKQLQTGNVGFYVFAMVIGICLMLLKLLF